MTPARRIAWSFGLVVATALGACTLNPQPLPPGDDSRAAGETGGDNTGGFGADPKAPPSPADAGVGLDVDAGNSRVDGGGDAQPPPSEAGSDAPIDAPLDGSSDVTTGG